MNQSPKKNKYIIKNQKLCSIPFLAIQPSSNTYSAHGNAAAACTYSWELTLENLFHRSGATSHRRYFRCQIFTPRQERSTWKPITCVPLMGFYARAIQPCAFQEVSAKHTRGLSQSLALGRGAGSMKGVLLMAVEASSCTNVSWMCISNYAAWLVSQYFWHQPRK